MDWGSVINAVGSATGGGVLGNWDGGWSTFSSGQSRTKYATKKALQNQIKLQTWQATQLPALTRQGLESAGYNPLLAIGGNDFAHGGSVSGSFEEPSSGGSRLDLLGAKSVLADIKLKEAQADRTRSEVGVDAWRPVHVSRSEAAHFGVNLLQQLGINLGTNNAESFTLFYNPITQELRNPFTGDGANAGSANTAEEIKELPKELKEDHSYNATKGAAWDNKFRAPPSQNLGKQTHHIQIR